MTKTTYYSPSRLPFIIAEMSGNHNQDIKRALQIVDAAAEAGVNALKIQTYTPDTITLDIHTGDFFIDLKDNNWKGTSLHKLYQKAYTPWEWHEKLFNRCKKRGIFGFSTPFDETAVDLLESLNVPFYKVASFELVHLPLIAYIAKTKKPIIMSTGMGTLQEIAEAVSTARANGCKDLTLLKCTSEYPAKPSSANLLTIEHMRQMFNCNVGLSDHTLGIGVAVASVALGATVIEKHITLRRADGGVDSACSLEPEEMAQLVIESKRAWEAKGTISYGLTETETTASLPHRRSIYVAQDLKKGDILTRENIRIVRPGYGLAPKYLELCLGKKITKTVKKGTRMSWELVMEK